MGGLDVTFVDTLGVPFDTLAELHADFFHGVQQRVSGDFHAFYLGGERRNEIRYYRRVVISADFHK
jgi:hypothetical protein